MTTIEELVQQVDELKASAAKWEDMCMLFTDQAAWKKLEEKIRLSNLDNENLRYALEFCVRAFGESGDIVNESIRVARAALATSADASDLLDFKRRNLFDLATTFHCRAKSGKKNEIPLTPEQILYNMYASVEIREIAQGI